MLRAVVDTNVLVSGLSRRGPEGAVIDAWAERRFRPCASTALALEYEEVLARKLGREKRETGMKALQALLTRCEYVPVRFTYRPASPDPGDDLVVDCVLNSQALLVTANVRDFRTPAAELGFSVVRPAEFLDQLEQEQAQ
jgi:putative PIN family toxin of toxin-antitoxin system